MVAEDKEIWIDFKANVVSKITPEYKKILCTLHAKYYNHKYYEPCSCDSKIYRMWIADIDRIYNI
jgi:hypothetical protein